MNGWGTMTKRTRTTGRKQAPNQKVWAYGRAWYDQPVELPITEYTENGVLIRQYAPRMAQGVGIMHSARMGVK